MAIVVLLSLAAISVSWPQPGTGEASFAVACQAISLAMSSASSVHWLGSGESYVEDITHYVASSTQQSACSVEPGTAEDVSVILRIVAAYKIPFAVKSGGHGMNPNYSSTPGVHIAMSRFNEIKYDTKSNTAEVGPGLIWDDVYGALDPLGVTVLGGRATGIGVGGLALGGGYSWKTNQFGLTVDNIRGYEVVLPNGKIATVTNESYPDLFWGLKGGSNNFGIVTKFHLVAYAQTEVWGGGLTFSSDYLDEVNAATAVFEETVTDPKAQILPTYNHVQGQFLIAMSLYYDAPTPPAGIFDAFLAIPAIGTDIKTRPIRDLIRTAPTNGTLGLRGIYHTVSIVKYTETVLAAIANETKFWGEYPFPGQTVISYSAEPFLPSIFSHAPEDSSAYPPNRTIGLSPLAISYAWNDSSADAAMHAAARASAAQLMRVLINDGQDVQNAAFYGNYAIFDTPLEKIYGRHLPRLRALKTKYDPHNVMGLAGGWKL